MRRLVILASVCLLAAAGPGGGGQPSVQRPRSGHHGPDLGPAGVARRPDGRLRPPHRRPRGRPRPHRSVGRRRRRHRSAAADHPRGGRLQPALVGRRRRDLLSVDPLRLVPDLEDPPGRRRGRAGERPGARRGQSGGLAGRQAPGVHARGLSGLPRGRGGGRRGRAGRGRACPGRACRGRSRGRPRGGRLHPGSPRRARRGQDHRPRLRPDLRPPLGHLEGRPALAPVRHVGRERARRASAPRDPGPRRRRAVEAVRRPGGDRLHARWPRARLHRPGRRRGGALVDRLRPLAGAAARHRRARLSDRGQRGLGHRAGLLARRQDAGLPGDGAARLRGRSLPHRAPRLAGRRAARADRGLGPLARRHRLRARRQDDLRHRRRHRRGQAVRDRRRQRRGAARWSAAATCARRRWPGDRLVYGKDHLQQPGGALHRRASTARTSAASPSVNGERLAAIRMGDYEQFSFAGWNDETVHGYLVKPVDFDPGRALPAGLPDPRRAAGFVRQRLPLPLEPADLRRRRLRGGDHRLPRLDRLRPGLHRLDHRRLGRQAARGPAEGPGRTRWSATPGSTASGSARSAPPTAAT